MDDSPLASEMEVVAGNTRDFDSVLSAMRGCRTVFHLAALIGIPYSYVSPLAYVRTNVEGTYNVLEAARSLEIERVLVTSTSETYGSAQYVPIDEKHPSVGQSPYAATKIAADQLALSYHRSFGLPVRVVRPFNTYGPRQSARAFIPTVITQILAGRKKLDLGNLTPTRDLTYVKDTVAGFLALAACRGFDGTAVNVGMGTEITMGDLAQRIAALMDVDVEPLMQPERVRPSGSEVERLVCDNTRIRELASWSPNYDLDSGLMETIAWMRSNSAKYKTTHYNV